MVWAICFSAGVSADAIAAGSSEATSKARNTTLRIEFPPKTRTHVASDTADASKCEGVRRSGRRHHAPGEARFPEWLFRLVTVPKGSFFPILPVAQSCGRRLGKLCGQAVGHTFSLPEF